VLNGQNTKQSAGVDFLNLETLTVLDNSENRFLLKEWPALERMVTAFSLFKNLAVVLVIRIICSMSN
jgi:hypothetical protein